MVQNNRSPAVLQIGVTGEASPGLSDPREGGGAPWTTQRLQLSHSDSLQSAIHSFDSISHLKSTVPSTFR